MRQALTEKDLVGRMQAGDSTAVTDLSTAYGPRIHQLAFRYMKNWEDAEEVTQDVLMKVHRKIGAFRGDVGEFFGDEFVDGKRVLCRFLWMRETPRWEQAFSDDGGTTWETNWTMTFTPE